MIKKITCLFLVLFLLNVSSLYSESYERPRMGIVISTTMIQDRWMNSQMGAHGWAAAANLAGIPYDCLYLTDLTEKDPLLRYDLLVITQCSYVDQKVYPDLVSALRKHMANGNHLIIEGPLAVYDETSKDLDHHRLDSLLEMEWIGFKGDSKMRIRVAANTHYITKLFEKGQFITQHLENGLNILQFKHDGEVLLVSADERESYPFLSCKEIGNSRVLLINDLSTWSGVPSFFRNEPPQVFYANQIYEVLVRTIHYALYGNMEDPFPVPQLSNANLTAIARLDGDVSENLDYQIKTINYLVSLAEESGVVPLYGWVSSGATKAGWPNLAPLAKKIEDVGGQIVTHSKYHNIDQEMNDQRWKEELDESIKEIEFATSDLGFPIGKVDMFINPGNTIPLFSYEEVAKRFSFMMTHGFCQNMPLGYGNCTWYTGQNRDFVVLEESPNMDYQWFYDPSWSYTTEQITAYEEAIFDHMFVTVGRGVIFNQTWHDYSINSAQFNKGKRIINKSNIAFYNAMRQKFATHDIYCPEPEDLANKLRAMAQWDYRWTSGNDQLEIQIDLSKVHNDTIAKYTGGMGLKIENTHLFIQQVFINDLSHQAFSDRLVILPSLKVGVNKIRINLGPRPAVNSHLTFVSKRMPSIRSKADDLEVDLLTRSKGKFNFYVGNPSVLLNADWQEYNRKDDGILRGFVTSDRQLILKKTGLNNFMMTQATFPITDYQESASEIALQIKGNGKSENTLWFSCSREPKTILLDSREIKAIKKSDKYSMTLPEIEKQKTLIIKF
jgi:hypothetical protein